MTTSPAERVRKLWREIDAWYEEHGATQNLRARRPGASERALAKLERATGVALPADYRASLAVHDGGGYFESYEYLGVEGVAGTWQGWHDVHASGELAKRPMNAPGPVKQWWHDAWLPFAADSCGNLYCVDAGPRPRLLALETQDAQGVYVLRGPKTFADWLGAYRDKLASGALAVDDEGFVDEPRLRPSVEGSGETLPELEGALSDRVEKLIARGKLEALARLFDEGKVPPRAALRYQRSLLGVAAEAGQLAVVELLIGRGADVNVGEAQGDRTPLFWALWGMTPKLAVVEYLLARGANPNALTRYDGTPLHAAVMWSQADAIRALLAHGADVTAKNAEGKTAAETATSPSQKAIRALFEGAKGAPAKTGAKGTPAKAGAKGKATRKGAR